MGKHIIGENGISYTKGTDGIYYPDLKLPEGEDYEIGRYGNMRLEYLKNHRKGLYLDLLTSGEDGISHGTDESRGRDYGRIKGKRTDEMGWINE